MMDFDGGSSGGTAVPLLLAVAAVPVAILGLGIALLGRRARR